MSRTARAQGPDQRQHPVFRSCGSKRKPPFQSSTVIASASAPAESAAAVGDRKCVFAIPGLGRPETIVRDSWRRDYPFIQGSVLMFQLAH